MTNKVSGFEKRKYLNSSSFGRVCFLYGLRRTGKTTLMLQAISELSDMDKAVYIKARVSDTMADFNQDLKLLFDEGIKYVCNGIFVI